MVTSGRFGNHENDEFSGFPKMKSKSDLSNMKQNNSTELLGHSFLTVYTTNAPPQTPNPDFSQIFYRMHELEPFLSTSSHWKPVLASQQSNPAAQNSAEVWAAIWRDTKQMGPHSTQKITPTIPSENPGKSEKMPDLGSGGSGGHFYCKFY